MWQIKTVQYSTDSWGGNTSKTLCQKSHTSDKMTDVKMRVKVCKFFNSGYCKFRSKCTFFHSKDRCEDECIGKNCQKRHPKVCRYGNKCKRKHTCEYKHSSGSNEQALKEQIAGLKTLIEELQSENRHFKESTENLKKELQSVKDKLDSKADKAKSPKVS